jgi:hypothetical protein
MKIKFWMVALALVLLVLVMYLFTGKKKDSQPPPGKAWTVYGSHNCGWTTKQLKDMDSKNVAYTFVDCDKDKEACTGMSGFPTLKNDDGTVKVGYTPM